MLWGRKRGGLRGSQLLWWCSIMLIVFGTIQLRARPGGTGPYPVRVAATFPALPDHEPISGFGLANALGNLIFDQPVGIYSPPGETNRLFIVERPGRVMVVTNLAAPTKTLFLDLTTRTEAAYIEAGLLGMAFHPDYAKNGYFYIYRTLETVTPTSLYGFHDQLSRFSVDPYDPNRALPDSELVLIAQPDASDEHNAGCVQFGPDGYLYLSLGDSANPGPIVTNYVQRIDGALFGGILRIDVDKRRGNLVPAPFVGATTNYAIPADNPFVGARQFLGSPVNPGNVRTEFFAVGFRNPWRMSFDRRTNRLYCGDVGAGAVEEIDIVVSGGNYGWPFYEGTQRGDPPLPDSINPIPPIFEYPHDRATFGGCVIGGFVYYGSALPGMNGRYFFGDFASGTIWALNPEGGSAASAQWVAALPQLSTFGLDPQSGDILAASLKDGTIRRIVYVDPASAVAPAGKLSQTGVFTDLASLKPATGLVPYQVNVSFWSDFALKRRWFCLPQGSGSIGFDPTNNWDFPTGTFWVKHFDLERIRGRPETAIHVETRILVKTENDVYGLTYRWLDNQQDAELVPVEGADREFIVSENGIDRSQIWHYPGRSECSICHTKQGGYALGFNTAQLNARLMYGTLITNQICALAAGGFLNTNQVNELTLLPGLAAADETNAPVQYRARSFFAANCSQCHQPGALGAHWDARILTPFKDALILNEPGESTEAENRIIVPGSVERSEIHRRLTAGLDTLFHMPPLATREFNPDAINLVAEWVTTMVSAPWQPVDIGYTKFEGSSSLKGSELILSGGGTGMNVSGDSVHFLYQTMAANGSILARVQSLDQSSSNCVAGLMLREDLSTASTCAALLATRDQWEFMVRDPLSGLIRQQTLSRGPGAGGWVRLMREGAKITADISADGTNWRSFVPENLDISETLYVGPCAASETRSPVITASFDSWNLTSIRLTSPTQFAAYDSDAFLYLSAEVTGQTNALISFYINGLKVGETTNTVFRAPVSNLPSGLISVSASVLDGIGRAIRSEPVKVQLTRPTARAVFLHEDDQTQGNWVINYGQRGNWLPGSISTIPKDLHFGFTGLGLRIGTINVPANDDRLLKDPGTGVPLRNVWMAGTSMGISLTIPADAPTVFSLYFFDPNQSGRQQVDWFDSDSDKLLDSRVVPEFPAPSYMTWALSGSLVARITSIGSANVSLGGMFFDNYIAPRVALGTPMVQTPPSPVQIEATALRGAQVSAVEFLENGQLTSIATVPPFAGIFSNIWAGVHTVTAHGIDANGFRGPDTSITFTVPDAPALAGDASRTTGFGTIWPLLYGTEAFLIPGYRESQTASIGLDVLQGSTFVFGYYSDHPSALLTDSLGSLASCLVADSNLIIELDLKDRNVHDLTLFFSEYGLNSRVERLTISDAETGQVVHSATIDQFGLGFFYSLTLQGHVYVVLTRELGRNVILNGIFVDSVLPRVAITSPVQDASFVASENYPVQIAAAGPDIRSIAVFDFDEEIGEVGPGVQTFAWTNVVTGDHSLSAVVSSAYGITTSSSVPFTAIQPESSGGAGQYEQWKNDHFSPADRLDSSRSGAMADPDGDGLNNIGEFVLGSDPLDASSRGQISAAIVADEFVISFSEVKGALGWHVGLQISTDLQTWSDAVDYTDEVLSDPGEVQNHTVHFALGSQLFFVRFSFGSDL
ncbi:MAG: hypothetical protein JWM99_584 [Verrucomicrobiales bacterium]|nr:hypothetical protein [Verrucomicrobiales bacterium]